MVNGTIVVLGAAGQLGADLVRILGGRAVPLTHADVDVRDAARLASVVPQGTDWVVNTAAFHDVERCEDEAEQAFAVNTLGARNVALAAARVKAGVVFFSTDYVFDGTSDSPYQEGDVVNPLNIYGASKAAGEMMTRLTNPRHLIVRTAYLFGRTGSGKGWNLVSAVLDQARRGNALRVARELVFSPTSTAHLAKKLVEVLETGMAGTIHLTNTGSCTREEFTRFVLAAAGHNASIVSISVAELPWRARRPLRSPLGSTVVPALGLAPMPDWRDAVREYLDRSTDYEPNLHNGTAS